MKIFVSLLMLSCLACSPITSATPTTSAGTTTPGSTGAPPATSTLSPTIKPTIQPTIQPTSPPSPTASPTQTPVPTNTPRPAPTPTPTQPSNQPPTTNVEVFIKNLVAPWAIDFAPDGRIWVTERAGRIRIVQNGQLQADPWMTLSVAATGEAGLLGLALDPQFAQNHFVYVAYTYRSQTGILQNRLVRLREEGGKGVMDKVLLDGAAGGGIHDGGRVKFGPDGKLYWTMGEAGNSSLAQNLSSPNGKILRLNPDGSIPSDNPFANSPVYSYGHRNPQGLAWQPGTGRLYETEHGPSGSPCCLDEVNYIERGKNYGWPTIMGDQAQEGMVTPIIQSGSSVTWAPSGATFITRGPWEGAFLFTGLLGQALYKLTLDKSDPRKVLNLEVLFQGKYGRLRDVVEGPDGALYILTSNRDGRGNPTAEDDRVLKLTVK